MSSSSAASDGEDYETRHRRTITTMDRGKKLNTYNPSRFSDEDLKDAGRKTEQEGKLSKVQQKESRQMQRNAANARERARMRVLSRAFCRLKTTLPWVPADTKLSKLDTLRLASSYISHLRQLLQDDTLEDGFAHPVSLTWPFMLAGRTDDNQDMSSTVRLCGATA
ncbi:transcription factor 21 [Thalassophryne amazonica]|uniref:transcription factor 21 n=1 Tax=Thalassophryne amazonica TaxID=390379 RepID=UPI00147214DF|nr:transcription factor 21 [Thalassophryne amazonica]